MLVTSPQIVVWDTIGEFGIAFTAILRVAEASAQPPVPVTV